MKQLSICIICVFLLSCGKKESDIDSDRISAFTSFLTKFQSIDFPFVYSMSANTSLDKLERIRINSFDTLFVTGEYSNEIICYGMLKDTAKYYCLIYLFPAEEYYPVLATYTKMGELISQEAISANGCGSDAGLVYCSSTTIINTDLTIFSADTLKYDFVLDSTGQVLPNSKVTITEYRSGNISSVGKINMSELERKEF